MTSVRREYTIDGNIVKVSIRPYSKSDPMLIMDYQIPGGKRQRPRLGTTDLDEAIEKVDTMVEQADFRAKFSVTPKVQRKHEADITDVQLARIIHLGEGDYNRGVLKLLEYWEENEGQWRKS